MGNKPNQILCFCPTSSSLINVTDRTCDEAYEEKLDIIDKRTVVEMEDLHKYPYNCIGLVVSYRKGCSRPVVGTGFLIEKRHVLTAAHNCYNKKNLDHPAAEEVYFIPNAHGKDI